MKILVTGAAGFLGSVLVQRLLTRGENCIRCFLRPGSQRGRLDALRAAHPAACMEYVVGNLTCRADAARAVEGVETIYHLAAGLRGSPADLFFNTVVSSKYLAEACADRKPLKFVLVSSLGVYAAANLPHGATITEDTTVEPSPQKRDAYNFAKVFQERVIREYQERHRFDLVILRPGVVYGPGGNALSLRVGLNLPGLFLHCGGGNLLPLTYVENCAEAIAVAAAHNGNPIQVYNVVDDNLPTSRRYLSQYKKRVAPIHSLFMPYPGIQALSKLIEKYHRVSKGQLPAFLTPYKSAALWKGNHFDNRRLKSIGWRQLVSTEEGMRRTFASLQQSHATKDSP